MRAFVLCVLVACGGAKSTPTTVVDKPIENATDPACPAAAAFKPEGGKLRCRELPVTADFPAGIELERQDSDKLTFIRAATERGVLALFVEPRMGAADDNLDGLKQRLQALVKGNAPDAVVEEAIPPVQPGATAATGISFKTPDGGLGVVHGYLAHGWFVAAVAGGRLAQNAARPHNPTRPAVHASINLRPTATTWEPRPVFSGVSLAMPVAAWEQLVEPDASAPGVPVKMYSAVAERVWIIAREIDQSPGCTLFDAFTDADVPALVKKMFGSEQVEVTGKIGGKGILYADLVTPGKTLAMYIICKDPRVVMVTITGQRPVAELKTVIDRITADLRR